MLLKALAQSHNAAPRSAKASSANSVTRKASSHPPETPTPTCPQRTRKFAIRVLSCANMARPTARRNTSPAATGRRPPSGFCRPPKAAAAYQTRAEVGTRPAAIRCASESSAARGPGKEQR